VIIRLSVCSGLHSCPVMLVVGHSSAHLDDTIDMNSKLDPKNSTWVKVRRCAIIVTHKLMCTVFTAVFLQSLCLATCCLDVLPHFIPEAVHTHTHNHFMALWTLSRTTGVSRY